MHCYEIIRLLDQKKYENEYDIPFLIIISVNTLFFIETRSLSSIMGILLNYLTMRTYSSLAEESYFPVSQTVTFKLFHWFTTQLKSHSTALWQNN